MRVEYINPFVETAERVLSEYVGGPVTKDSLALKSTAQPILGCAAFVGLAGDVEGRVLFDMSQETALKIASKMNGGETFAAFDEMVAATITELANVITGQAVTKLHELGFRFDLTPPVLFTGEKIQIMKLDREVEALIIPLNTEEGRVEINVAIRERN